MRFHPKTSRNIQKQWQSPPRINYSGIRLTALMSSFLRSEWPSYTNKQCVNKKKIPIWKSILSEPWIVSYLLRDFHWHWFMFLTASDLRDFLGNNRSRENNRSIWWNYIFFISFFSLTDCLCFLTNTLECLSPVHTGSGVITKLRNNVVLELSWRHINSVILSALSTMLPAFVLALTGDV